MNTTSRETILVYPTADLLTRTAASDFVTWAREAITDHGAFTVALSGGSTPKQLYALLAGEAGGAFTAPWDHIHCFFGDERHVGPDHAESNFKMANDALLSRLHIPAENIHRIHGENPDAAQAAADYEAELRDFFIPRELVHDGFPRFDLILLGMGPDGHTASLFPGTPALEEKSRWVVANRVEKLQTDRITFTFPVLNHADRVALFIAGPDKAEMIREVLVTYKDAPRYPVQGVQPVDGEKIWLLDQAAAAKLPQ